MRPSCVTVLGLAGSVALAASPAHAQVAVLADLAAPPELAEEAAAVSLLVRSMIAPGARKLATRKQLVTVLAASGPRPKSLGVEPRIANHVMEKLAADRLFLGTLTVDGETMIAVGQVLGPTGAALAEIRASAPRGEIAALARDLARKLAPRLEAGLGGRRSASLWELRPFVTAGSALLAGDNAAAARAIATASPGVGDRVPAVKEIGWALAGDAGLPLSDRINAAVAVRDDAAATRLADGELARNPRSVEARVGKARRLIATGKLTEAEGELARGGRADSAVVSLARAELALTFADQRDRDEALRPLLKSPTLFQAGLGLIAGAPPGILGPSLEEAVIDRAEKAAPKNPGLVSAVGYRALRAGVQVRRAVRLLRPEDFTLDELAAVRERIDALAAAGDPAATSLAAVIQIRHRRSRELQAERGAASGRGQGRAATSELASLLSRLGIDGDARPSAVLVAALPGSGQPIYWPVRVERDRLRRQLVDGLSGPPYELELTEMPPDVEWTEGTATDPRRLKKLGEEGIDLVLLYRIETQRLDGVVTLVAVRVPRGAVSRHSLVRPFFRTALVRVNPMPLVVAAAAIAVFLGLVSIALRQLNGAIVVTIIEDPGAQDEKLTVFINRSPTCEPVKNAAVYEILMRKRGKVQKRFKAYNAGMHTKFSAIPRGRWYVHVIGTYLKGNDVRALEEGLTQRAVVKTRKTEFLTFNLVPGFAEFYIDVFDGNEPVKGAKAWVEGSRAKPATTDANGKCFLLVPRGHRVVWVEARGIQVPRPLEVFKTSAQDLKINLVWERRVDDASRALEHSARSMPAVAGAQSEDPGKRKK